MPDSAENWFEPDINLAPPFNRWPRWVVEFDMDLGDRAQDYLYQDDAEEHDPFQDGVAKGLDKARDLLQKWMERIIGTVR